MSLKDLILKPLAAVSENFSPELTHDDDPHFRNNVYCFYAPGGSAGVTTAVANLAYTLAQSGAKIALVDFDLYHPCLHYFFADISDTGTNHKSVLDKFLSTSPAVNFSWKTKSPFVSLYSALPSDDVSQLCDLNEENITEFLSELSHLYTYVLIDAKGTLNDEWVTAAIDFSRRTFNFVTPTRVSVERAFKDVMTMSNYDLGRHKRDIIQNQISDFELSENDFSVGNLSLMLNLPYSPYIERVCLNGDIFMEVSGSGDKQGRMYASGISKLATGIINDNIDAEEIPNPSLAEEVETDGTQ